MNLRICLLMIAACVLAVACGHPETFRVDGKLDDGATLNLRPVYHTERGVMTGVTPANSGAFAFEGSAPAGALLEIYDNDYRLQARFPVHNGKDLKVKVNRSNRYASTVEGDEQAEAYMAFLNEHADEFKEGTPERRNALIARYITDNPASEVSLMLLWGEFDVARQPQLADSLAGILDADVKAYPPAARFLESLTRLPATKVDSIEFRVHGGRRMFLAAEDAPALLVFSDSRTTEHRKFADSLRNIVEKTRAVKVFDLNCDADTSTWRRITMPDSATWTQGWLEGGPAAPGVAALELPTLPYYIVVDSAGHTLRRTTSADTALNTILSTF
ncbi:MAG: hypothetical protein K2M61_00470 [Muribaculaceae bacterium]|nr:hypothetical protein [Muribaculaceae bacterium]